MSASAGHAHGVGVLVGAAIGAIGRVAVMSLHLSSPTEGTALILLIAALAGALIGALASLPGKPLAGALAGAVLAGVLYVVAIPAVWLLHMLGALTLPSVFEMMAAGALAGGAGGMVTQRAARRTAPQ
jgi:hypothetical protein